MLISLRNRPRKPLILETAMMLTPSELFDRVGYTPDVLTDPLVMSTEAACFIAGAAPETRPNWLVVADAQHALPPSATDFERGLTAGIALMLLATEPPRQVSDEDRYQELVSAANAAPADSALVERIRCVDIARLFIGYAAESMGSAHSREAKELAEATAKWIENEMLNAAPHSCQLPF